MKEGWMKNDKEWMKNDEGWMMKDDDFKLLRGFENRRTDICDCRVAFATENSENTLWLWDFDWIHPFEKENDTLLKLATSIDMSLKVHTISPDI